MLESVLFAVNGANTSSTLVNETGIKLILEALRLALRDLVKVVPDILIALTIIAIYLAIAIILTRLVKKIFIVFKVDEILKPLLKHAYFSVTNLVLVLMNIGLALIALYSIILILFPEQVHATTLVINYAARLASVIFLIFFIFIALNTVVERIRMEAKLKGFILLVTLFMTIVPLLDVTALSQEVKTALAWGISIGIGLAIGVFAAWYFFHEILEEKLKQEKRHEEDQEKPQ